MHKWAKLWVKKIQEAKLLPYRNRNAMQRKCQDKKHKDLIPDKISPMKSHLLLCPSLPNVHSTTKPSMDWFITIMMVQILLNTVTLRVKHSAHEPLQDISGPNSSKSLQEHDNKWPSFIGPYPDNASQDFNRWLSGIQKSLNRDIINECLLIHGRPISGIFVMKAQID